MNVEPEVVVSDIKMPDIDGLDLLRKMKEIHSSLPIIIMTAYADLDKAVESFSSGAFEYLPKPFDIEEMLKIVKRAKRKRKDKESISDSKIEFEQTEEIVGSSSAMQSVFRIIGRLSSSDMTVLVTGESALQEKDSGAFFTQAQSKKKWAFDSYKCSCNSSRSFRVRVVWS